MVPRADDERHPLTGVQGLVGEPLSLAVVPAARLRALQLWLDRS